MIFNALLLLLQKNYHYSLFAFRHDAQVTTSNFSFKFLTSGRRAVAGAKTKGQEERTTSADGWRERKS